EFYSLFVITRRRQHLPPIPYAWFRNLIRYQGEALDIRLAYKEKTPISAILTLRFRDAVYYKYGCSDSQFNKFGGMPWLLWRAIAAAKLLGATKFDMGRTEEQNVGLVRFKNHWVPRPQRIVYWTFPDNSSLASVDGWKLKAAKHLFSCMPNRLLTLTGKLIYRHIA
ncbi:MAG: GNAT family N-acetyltransferase, partial [Candidatus Acidiferrales bacterium]